MGASQARGGPPGSGYLSAVELSFEISFDGLKRCGYLVVGTKLRFQENDMAEDAFDNYLREINRAYLRRDATEHTHRPDEQRSDNRMRGEWKQRTCGFRPE